MTDPDFPESELGKWPSGEPRRVRPGDRDWLHPAWQDEQRRRGRQLVFAVALTLAIVTAAFVWAVR